MLILLLCHSQRYPLCSNAPGDGEIVEAGGQYIGPTQDRMAALARALGVDTYPTYAEGAQVVVVEGGP